MDVDIYRDKLVALANKLRPWYDIDKVKLYGVYVWTKEESIYDEENIFDIYRDGLHWFIEPRDIPEPAQKIIDDIIWFIDTYYDEIIVES